MHDIPHTHTTQVTRRRALIGAVLATCLALPCTLNAQSATEPVVFDVTLRGLRAATLTMTGSEKAGRYSVRGNLESNGVVGIVRKVRYDARTEGRVRNGRYTPETYSETTDTGKRRSDAVVAYQRGVPQVKAYNPPRPPRDGDLDPATQGGTVDPLTALFATLRDVAPDRACDVALQVFDGRRRSQVTLSDPQPDGDRVRCTGEYRRVAGFSAEDMAERTRFPFSVVLAPTNGNRLRVTGIEVETLFGRAILRRR